MRIWLRPLPFALLFAYLAVRADRAPVDDAAASKSSALCTTLSKLKHPQDRVTCVAEDVTWLDPPPSAIRSATGKTARAVVRGKGAPEQDEMGGPPSEASYDLFLTTARLSPEGRLLDVIDSYDLTHTSSAEETKPVVSGTLLAYVVEVGGQPGAVHVLDLAGHETHAYEDLNRFQKTQIHINDWQATGLTKGVKHTVYALNPAPKTAALSFDDKGRLTIKTDAHDIVIDAQKSEIIDGNAFARVSPEENIPKPPEFSAWMSERLRKASWFGDENNQLLKYVAFTLKEWASGTKAKLTGDTGAKDVENDLGSVTGKVEFTDPETGWPPKALEPMIKPPLSNEGQWIALENDPFITPTAGATPFLTTFVRTDPAAQHTRVYITLWDPRLIALHMVAGTVEPVSATGEAGPGVIPRTPEVMKHVVAGFNGGFQATHGEFGMQADNVLYLPPKPYAATVAELRDGTTAFGAWPNDAKVPEEVLSFRQNMTALVENGKYNPWQRNWWGGVPPGWPDAIHTTRSGVCITKEGFVGYFYGSDIGPEPLGKAMIIAGCKFGIHLDMNPGLAGFEFYNVQPANTFQALGRPLQPDWEYEGGLKDLPDLKFRSRRMVKSMGHMLFPRYIHRDARDFFYLTARASLPGAQIGDAPWRTKGLPQHGYPHAMALTTTKLENGKTVRVMRLDPRTVKSGDGEQVVASFGRAPGKRDPKAPPPTPTEKKLWLGPHVFTIDKNAPEGGIAIAEVTPSGDAHAAVGISDDDGMLQWLELDDKDKGDAQSSEQMLKLLEKLGCSSRALVANETRVYPGASLDVGGQPTPVPNASIRLVRAASPGAKTIFDDVEPVAPSVWSPLQQARVKWRPTLAPPDKPAGSASAGGTPSAAPK